MLNSKREFMKHGSNLGWKKWESTRQKWNHCIEHTDLREDCFHFLLLQTASPKDSRVWPMSRCTSWPPSTILSPALRSINRLDHTFGDVLCHLSVMSLCWEVNYDVCRPFLHLSAQGNQTELCKSCKSTYKELNELYSRMETNQTMCIDIEDSVCMSGTDHSRNSPFMMRREKTAPPRGIWAH